MNLTLNPLRLGHFYRELRRRKVIRVAIVYIVVSWVAIEAASVVFPELMLPEWSVRLLIVLAAFGFPFVVVLAWVFDITPEGVQRTAAPTTDAVDPPAPSRLPAQAVRAERPAPPQRSLAVLPFRNIGADQENEYFCEGLAEDLLIVLSRVKGLRVAARSSAFAFRDEASDVRAIGERLNVASVLEGSVRKSGRQLRIAVRLVDTADGYQRWTKSFDVEFGDIFEIQDEISRAVFDALEVEIFGAERPQIAPGTRDVEAYNLYLMGRHQFHKRTEESLRSAVQFFEQAITRDARFALPYTGLADAYGLLSNSGEAYGRMPLEEAIARASPMVERALELAPGLAEAHASRGFLDRLRHDFAGAERSLRRALELNPGYPMAHVWLGLTLSDLGRLREALAEYERAYEADPLSPIVGSNLGFAHFKFAAFDTARECFERVIQIAPDFPIPYSGMAHLERRLGRPDQAEQWWQQASRISPNRALYPANLSMLQLEQENQSAAEQFLRHAETLSPNDPVVVRTRMAVLIASRRDADLLCFTEERLSGERSDADTLANAALAQLLNGQPDRAVQYYERAGMQRWISDSLIWSWRFPHGLYCADALLQTGAREAGLALLDQAEQLMDRLAAEGLVNPDMDYQRAVVASLRGEQQAALAAFERAIEGGWRTRWWARRDPGLAGLRAQTTLPI